MKCIYCNNDTELTISDIIPAALTGAKLKKRFVCRAHNSFTNDCYEKAVIRQLDIFRNRIGLTERDGDPVRFSANLSIGEYTSEKTLIYRIGQNGITFQKVLSNRDNLCLCSLLLLTLTFLFQ